MFVNFCIQIEMITKHIMYPDKTDPDKVFKQVYSIYMLVFNVLRLCILMPYRNPDRTYTQFSLYKWGLVFFLELIGASLFFFMSEVKGTNTFASCLIDVITLFSMYI